MNDEVNRHFCLDDSPEFRMMELDEVTSTNDFLKSYRPMQERRMTLVTAEYQTAGRGSGQNHWESQRGKNLLFSLLTHPRHIPAERMFVLSEVLALAIRQAAIALCGEWNGNSGEWRVESGERNVLDLQNNTQGENVSSLHSPLSTLHLKMRIKWPNDIYYGDRKLCGMLIENELRGTVVERCVMGVGINVNQTEFASDAPNPVSLAQILGHEVERRFVLERIIEYFTRYYSWTEQGRADELHQMYLGHLYGKDEKRHFIDKDVEFQGTIVDVEPTGHLIIVDEKGEKRRYAFKEVQYVILAP